MDENRGRATAGALEGFGDSSPSDRLDGVRAGQILERAAALHVERSSQIELERVRRQLQRMLKPGE